MGKTNKITKKQQREFEQHSKKEAEKQADRQQSDLPRVQTVAFCEITRACIGSDDLDALSSFGIPEYEGITGTFDESSDDLLKHFDDQGKRLVQRKEAKGKTGAKPGKKQKGANKSTSSQGGRSGWCSFPVIMISCVVLLLAFLAYLKVSEESFGVKQHYEEIDYYALLEVPRSAKFDEIKRAYRKLTIKWHPDRNPGCEDCAQKMGQINEAYIVLGNPETKQFHDQHGVKPPESMISLAKQKQYVAFGVPS